MMRMTTGCRLSNPNRQKAVKIYIFRRGSDYTCHPSEADGKNTVNFAREKSFIRKSTKQVPELFFINHYKHGDEYELNCNARKRLCKGTGIKGSEGKA